MDAETGQVIASAAQVYEQFFVPALFGQWTGPVLDAAAVAPGQRVLDVACGTGVLARDAVARVGDAGAVVGLDRNQGMLDVAQGLSDQVDWRLGQAEAMPFADAAFDAVVSQFGLMFFEDRAAALREMVRVLRPGGTLAVAVWASLDVTPGYAEMVNILQRLFGDTAADALRAPYVLGDPAALQSLFADAGIADARVATHDGVATFPSIASWVHTDVKGWTLADMIDDAQYAELKAAAATDLKPFVQPDGSVRFAHPALIVTATKP